LKKGDGSPSPFLLATTMNPILQTERLILRPYQLSDAPALQSRAGSLAIARMLARMPHPYPAGEAERWISTHDDRRAEGTGYPFAIEKDGDLVGTIAVERGDCGAFELGYWLTEPAWGQGLASEAVRGILAFAFDELGLAYVRALYTADNRASARVLTKAGFLSTGRSRTFHPVRQAEVEMVHVVLLRDAFIRDDSGAKQVYKAA
jgi:RimJ/RimL family protein N-acetyltransferase